MAERKPPKPEDLLQFAPSGNGIYGYQPQAVTAPLKGAPIQEAEGGVVYFRNDITREELSTMLRLMGITQQGSKPIHDYALYQAESDEPFENRYLRQARFVREFALHCLFQSHPEDQKVEPQELDVVAQCWQFIEAERKRWGTFFADSPNLAGKFGGDGNWAREELCFGLMMENAYYGIWRIWSRAWLVTK